MQKTRSINLLVLLLTVPVLVACGVSTSGDASAGATPEPSVAPVEEPTSGSTAEPAAVPTGGISELQVEAEMLDLDALTAHPWQWVSFTNPAERFDVDGPENYLLTFNEDGTLSLKAGCNDAGGSYKASGSGLAIQIGPMTMAACPGGSRGDQFVTLLGAANYFFEDGQLFIDLMADGGTMTFVPADDGSIRTGEGAPPGSPTAVLADILGDLTYDGLLPDQPVMLTAGVAYYDDQNTGRPFVRLVDHLIPTGDLDGDGAEDAAAFLVDYTTGSADFVHLVVVLNAWTEPTPLEALLIGDRTPVKSMTIADSQVIVEYLAPGPGDAACCPSQLTRQVFGLGDGRLLESGREELGPISFADLTGTGWRLVDLNLDQEPVPPGTEVTLNVNEDQISGSAGCNDYTAGVTAGEDGLPQSLTAGPIAASPMLCDDPEATLENTYLARLGKVVAWRYAFGFLSLTYELEDSVLGELLFAPAGS